MEDRGSWTDVNWVTAAMGSMFILCAVLLAVTSTFDCFMLYCVGTMNGLVWGLNVRDEKKEKKTECE